MPKAFSEEEQNRIREALLASGRERFTRFGVRKTTVDELTADAGIAKGTFYRFYESKELLYLEVLEEAEERIRGGLMQGIRDGAGVGYVLSAFLHGLEQEPLFSHIVQPGEMEYLVSRVGAERLQVHMKRDREELLDMVIEMQHRGAVSENIEAEVLVELLRALIAIPLLQPRMNLSNKAEVYQLLTSALEAGLGPGGDHADRE